MNIMLIRSESTRSLERQWSLIFVQPISDINILENLEKFKFSQKFEQDFLLGKFIWTENESIDSLKAFRFNF